MTELEALRRVAEAAREELRCLIHLRSELIGRIEGDAARKFFGVVGRAIDRLHAVFDALDAQAPAGEVVRPPLSDVLAAIGEEVASAEAKWPPMNSAHEAYAVLAEEVDELWDHVKVNQKRRDMPGMRKEAIQVAAMAVRFVRDVCDLHKGAK